MPFFRKNQVIATEKNGDMYTRFMEGEMRIRVGASTQSGHSISTMWRNVLNRIPKTQPIKHVLLLGLGAGGAIREIHRRFPRAFVTAVEWDPVMVQFVRERQLLQKPEQVEIIQGDAVNVLKVLPHTFDLILIDLFHARDPEPRLASPDMIADLHRVLAYDGFLALNAFEQRALFSQFRKFLSEHACWNFHGNNLAVYRHAGQGHPNDAPPSGFIHPMQSLRYLRGTVYKEYARFRVLGDEGRYGMRQKMGFFTLDIYIGNEMPILEPAGGLRMVVWQPVTKIPRPFGWLPWPVSTQSRLHGVADLSLAQEYWKLWDDHAQRHRKKWLAQKALTIKEISFEEFRDAYTASGKLPKSRRSMIEMVRRRMEHPDHGVMILGAHEKSGGIVAALVICDLPDISVSVHLAAFIHPAFEKTSVGTGLIDAWYQHNKAHGIRFAYFGIVWSKGDPKEWKGYSQFKRQFHLYLLRSPLPFVRFACKTFPSSPKKAP